MKTTIDRRLDGDLFLLFGETEDLCCPNCDGKELSICDVEVYLRGKEDSRFGTAVRVQNIDAVNGVPSGVVPIAMSQNPSPRRSGIRITVICRDCPDSGDQDFNTVEVYEHKGRLLVGWVGE